MIQMLTSGSSATDALAAPAFLPPLVRGEPPNGPGTTDAAGAIRESSTPMNVHQLLRSGRKSIQLLSPERIDELISRAVRVIVEKHRATGALPDPLSQSRMEAGAKQTFDDLLSQHRQTAKAADDLALSKAALDTE